MTDKFTHIGLFEGIGGFSLAARWMSWETLAWCEWNEFGQKVLKHHFPEAEGFGDITKTDFKKYANRIDILTGGFPCQPYSLAGKRKGKEDERHLWPEMLRAIREIRPAYVVGENVYGLINWNGGMVFNEVQTDLEAEGFEVWAYVLPACAVNAPHKRDRIWFVAYNEHNRNRRRQQQPQGEQETNRTTQNTGRDGCGNGEHDEQVSKRNERELSTGSEKRFSVGEIIQDAADTGLFGQEKYEKQTARIEQCDKLDALHTDGRRLEERICESTQQSETHSNVDKSNNIRSWQDFPTQSPICGGDDGLPR